MLISIPDFTDIFRQFTGPSLEDANKPIQQADALLKSTLSRNTDGQPIGEASFLIAKDYVNSYKTAMNKYIKAVTMKHKLIELGGKYLAEMQDQKVKAERDGANHETFGMKLFLNKHNIPRVEYGDERHNAKEWQVNIEHLNNWIKGRSNEVETDVIKLNDIINKQNQILQSTTTILKKSHELLEGLIRSMS